MYLSNKIRNVMRRVIQVWGTDAMKRAVWDKDFATGHWDRLENTADDVIYEYLVKYCKNGSLLDLGCGSGNTGCELEESAYHDYTGIDISDVAIQKARRRCDAIGRSRKNQYFQSNITTYTPDRKYDVVLFRESIYYVPKWAIKGLLERSAHWLKDDGVLIIRMHPKQESEALLSSALEDYVVVERHEADEAGPFIVVLKQKQAATAARSGKADSLATTKDVA